MKNKKKLLVIIAILMSAPLYGCCFRLDPYEVAQEKAAEHFFRHAIRSGTPDQMKKAIQYMEIIEGVNSNFINRFFSSPASLSGLSPLHVAARYNRDIRVIQILIERGANPHAEDLHKRLPWQLAPKKSAIRDYLHSVTCWPRLGDE